MVVGFSFVDVKHSFQSPTIVYLVYLSPSPSPSPSPSLSPSLHNIRSHKPLEFLRSQPSHKQQKNLSCTCKLLDFLIFPTKYHHQQPKPNSSNMDKVGGGQPSFMDQLETSHPISRSSFVNKQLPPSFNTHPSDFLSQYLFSSPLRNHTKRC